MRSCRDLSDFEQFEAERLDLRKDAKQRGSIFKPTAEQGLAALRLRLHRGKGGQRGGSEPTLDPDCVQARRHVIILQPDLVSRRRRDLVIVRYLSDVRERSVERSRSSRAR